MSAKRGARLWWEEARGKWCIIDSGKKSRTAHGRGELAEAERELEAYLLSKRQREAAAPVKGRHLSQVSVAEVIAWGGEHLAPRVARPSEWLQRAEACLAAFGDLMADELDADAMEAMADELGSSYARRCIEDLRAAWNRYRKRYQIREDIVWTLPPKSQPRADYLTFREAVALGRVMLHTPGVRWSHMVPFLVVGIATATRSSRIYRASFYPEVGRPWLDLETGTYHRTWTGEKVAKNKKAPTVPLSSRLVRWLRRLASDRIVRGKLKPGKRYLVEYAGRPADCRDAFKAAVLEAKKQYPKLFRHEDGTTKAIVRHSLRHTGVSWLSQAGIPPLEICDYSGMSMEVYSRVYAHATKTHKDVLEHQSKRTKSKAKRPETEDA